MVREREAMRSRIILLVLTLMLALEPRAFSSAFAINELGARAQGMAGAFTAVADDGSAMFFNPAGLASQKRIAMEMHSLVVVGLFRFTPSDVPNGQEVPEKGYAGLVKPHFIAVANTYAVLPMSPKLTL